MKQEFHQVRKVMALLAPRERKLLILVTIGSIFMAIIDVIGVGSIMPFMAVATKPETIHTNVILKYVYNFFAFKTDASFLIFLGIGVLSFLVFSNASQVFVYFIKVKFTSMRRHTLSLRLFKGYLSKAYPFFLNSNSYELIKNINSEIDQMIHGTLMQSVDLISRVFQVVLLTALLFIVNPFSTLGITFAIAGTYGIIYKVSRKKIRKLGTERFDLYTQQSGVISEAFWGIKEIKITGLENAFINAYIQPSKKMSRNDATQELISDLPKFALETAAFSAIMILVLMEIVKSGTFQSVAAIVSLYAFAGYRMIPAVQAIFKALTKLKYGASTAERMLLEFEKIASTTLPDEKQIPRLPYKDSLELKSIVFSYQGSIAPTINNLSIAIKSNSLIGFAGKTGSGKTTLIDIILGLLQPSSGSLIVDGTTIIDENLRSWQTNLGYVPQNIYLSNATIAANIAFGIPPSLINPVLVENAAKMAQIHDFISSELPNGYETYVGERGIRLSGGQRQRIGIARALYRNPSVLVLDEATSALDTHTEESVMDAVDSLAGTRTIILIAHRLSTLARCDIIYLLEKGKIVDAGRYDELMKRNHFFKKSFEGNS